MAVASALVLRDYQETAVAQLRDAMRSNRCVLLQLPTGGGKTAIASFITAETVARGKRVAFICHRNELVEQTSLTWRRYGIAHGFISAGRPRTVAMANICSIDTLKDRLLTTPPPDVAIWDECHHLGAAGWRRVMDAWGSTRHIGLSATPWRLDGGGLGSQFQAMVQGPSPQWLIEHGHLSRYELYAPNPPSMTGAARERGDYSKRDASERMDMPKRTGDIVSHWLKCANGLKTIAFAVNVADSKTIVERFNGCGISAAHLDADTDPAERKRVIREFSVGGIMVLSNVALFGEGFDLSAIAQTSVTIDALIDAAPTQSLSAVLQRWGRVLRPKSFAAVVLDHAGNSNRHGFPDDDRPWSLAGRERSRRGGKADPDALPPPYTCKCFRQIRRPLPGHCPYCRVQIEADAKPVVEGEGELRKLSSADRAAQRAARKREENNATTLQALVDLARRRGYPNPTGWAFSKFTNSKWRQRLNKESEDEFFATRVST